MVVLLCEKIQPTVYRQHPWKTRWPRPSATCIASGRLGSERSAQYIFDKFAEYSKADAELQIVPKGNLEFDLHDLSGQRFDSELREHLNHFTIGRFVELVLENSVKAKQSAAAIKSASRALPDESGCVRLAWIKHAQLQEHGRHRGGDCWEARTL